MKYLLFVILCVPFLLTAQAPETVKRYNDAVKAAKKKDHESAVKIYSEVVEMDPSYFKAYLNMGTSYMRLKDYESALATYDKCLKLEPENGKVHYLAGQCSMKMEKNGDAIESFTSALNYNPKLTKTYYYRAKIQMDNKSYDKAITDFQDAITKDKASEKTYYYLGVCYLRKKNQDSLARESFKLALGQKEDYIPALTEITKLAYKQDDFSAAIEMANRLQAADPNNPKAPYYRAMSLMKTDQLAPAYASFDELLVIEKNNKYALANKASISLKQKNYKAAVGDYNILIAKHPKKKHYYNRALSQMQLEAWQLALNDLNEVIDQDEKYAEAYFNRSNVQLQLGYKDKACSDMQQAAKLGYTKANDYLLSTCGS